MTKSVFDFIRIIPREATFLDRKSGSRGEIFYDRDSNTLRLYDGSDAQGGISLAKSDLSNVTDASFLSKAQTAGVGGAGGSGEITIAADDSTQQIIGAGEVFSILGGDGIQTTTDAEGALTVTNTANTFSTVAVAGQSSVVAETISDTLNIVAGNNVIITTDASTDSITISASAGASTNSFATFAVTGQNSVIAETSTDTLTLIAGSGISITTDNDADSVTITNTRSAGVTNFSALTDAGSTNSTIDKIYLPAITMLNVTNNGATSYRFDQYGNSDNPTVYAINRTTIAFNLDVEGHPFYIQDGTGTQYDTGLVHVTTSGTVTTGINAQGKESGTLYWKIPSSISGGYRYQCGVHAAMVGSISIKDFVAI